MRLLVVCRHDIFVQIPECVLMYVCLGYHVNLNHALQKMTDVQVETTGGRQTTAVTNRHRPPTPSKQQEGDRPLPSPTDTVHLLLGVS